MHDPIEAALDAGEERIAEILAERRVRETRGSAEQIAALRRRAAVALETALDDGPSAPVAHRALTADPAATPEDHEALGWAELLADGAGRADRAFVAAGGSGPGRAAVAFVRRPSPQTRAGLEAALADVDPDRLERVVRLLVQRFHDALSLSERLVSMRGSPPWTRPVARAVRLQVMALRTVDRRAEAAAVWVDWLARCADLGPDHPRYGGIEEARAAEAPPEEALAHRERRLARVLRDHGDDDALVEPALSAVGYDAHRAGAHALAVRALTELDRRLAKRKNATVRQARRDMLGSLVASLLALGRTDEALQVVEREEALRASFGFPVPYHLARARVAYARGDLDVYVAHHEAELARCEAGAPPSEGPTGHTTRLVRGWTEQARERRREGGRAR